MPRRNPHEVVVEAWLANSEAKGLPRDALLDLFEAALSMIWSRTSTSLGEITLTAIASRVLHNAGEQFPAFASLNVEPGGRLEAGELRHNIAELGHMELVAGMRFVLVEFLTVLGNLTAELLTSELHEVLGTIAPSRAARVAPRRLSGASSHTRKRKA